MSVKQAIRLHNSCVVSTLLDAAKTRGITQADKKRFDAFAGRCLGSMYNVKQHHYARDIKFQKIKGNDITYFLTRLELWWDVALTSSAKCGL